MLTAVSLGPGDESLLTPAARQAIAQADVVAGYKGYIELVPPGLLAGKEVVSTGMMGEVERARMAVASARSGRRTVMVCSGDAGIYAMAGLLLEILEVEGLLDAVAFSVVPGVPAFAAAAALLGAPLMHDFASVSLSDLLTPWEVIEKRLKLAAEADFVIAIYNPRSKKRDDHLTRALAVIGGSRAPGTPVGVVGRANRPGQSVLVTTLGAVDTGLVDMQTVLLVGNSATRIAGGRMLTPRGYHRKYEMGNNA
ncbi:MAG: precorrin-3B C(17)-methyltransferase [Pseudodesulfovibrio sp.]|uniref:Precorrin-3B C17-methyltransferase n=1 Tax=Pseudodesulfovibrio aespoeensis (strain ATCC 700646 / DSM 10631 / Aspo-2) TaxID=643562 RepID=E6VQP5_PSEA9|nr:MULTISPECIES: precorrin-3B C(17)-methyltransferase [Pseudodesulfovibrio]MBU4192090.1 precorrin-3B C(17)-methyltransferase [Pseudomonadota bacterium]ADU61772.1 precorrin-3B C17-methyltransferase [Pseudodesulfovibrio aespoeensis Aspo-2]MBU4243045.1 precorrin-3B C(17)-methyltransferase [Pseudomonadota bacterium]MBU4475832.1 precorrin-3B C(17)-methyltransferase [Pseudomonadota bacterium]MBU4515815.1 precorrin-3B C(17)-methyltransferase [Pseudomonadota bacterium]